MLHLKHDGLALSYISRLRRSDWVSSSPASFKMTRSGKHHFSAVNVTPPPKKKRWERWMYVIMVMRKCSLSEAADGLSNCAHPTFVLGATSSHVLNASWIHWKRSIPLIYVPPNGTPICHFLLAAHLYAIPFLPVFHSLPSAVMGWQVKGGTSTLTLKAVSPISPGTRCTLALLYSHLFFLEESLKNAICQISTTGYFSQPCLIIPSHSIQCCSRDKQLCRAFAQWLHVRAVTASIHPPPQLNFQ